MLQSLAVVLGLFLFVGIYFWAHKPFTGPILRGLGETALAIVVWLLVLAMGLVLGRAAIKDLPLPLQLGLGLGAISLLVFGLGALGLMRAWAAWALAALILVPGRHALRALLADLRAVRLPRPADRFERWLLVFIAGSLALSFALALAPDVAWDSHVYHLTIPRTYADLGRIGHPVDLLYFGFPQLGEMQTTLALLLGTDRAASLIHFTYGLMAAWLVADLARRYFGRREAWLSVAILLSAPSLLGLMAQAYVEATLLFYATASLYAFLRWRASWLAGREERRWLWLAGALLGLAGGVKYTAVGLPLAFAPALLLTARRDGAATNLRRLLLTGSVAGALVLPWLIENWLTTGNPLYPFFREQALYWDAWRAWFYDRPGTGFWPAEWPRLLLAPFEASLIGAEGSAAYDATIGPFALLLPFLLLPVWPALTRDERPVIGHLALFLGVNVAVWSWGLARSALLLQSRLLLPAFGPAALLGAVALSRLGTLRRPQLAVDWLAHAAFSLALGLLLTTQLFGFFVANPFPVIVGLESREAYYARLLGPYPVAMSAINDLPADARVQFLWEPRTYLCQVDCRSDPVLDVFLHLTQGLDLDAEGIADYWREAGVTHVLLSQRGYQFVLDQAFDSVTPRDQAVLNALQTNQFELVASVEDAYLLYRLK